MNECFFVPVTGTSSALDLLSQDLNDFWPKGEKSLNKLRAEEVVVIGMKNVYLFKNLSDEDILCIF